VRGLRFRNNRGKAAWPLQRVDDSSEQGANGTMIFPSFRWGQIPEIASAAFTSKLTITCVIWPRKQDTNGNWDHQKAYKSAQEKIFAIRQTTSAIADSKRVFAKHGSRKKRDPLPKSKKAPGFRQLSLFDDTDDPSCSNV
jgi:hypothetical protein